MYIEVTIDGNVYIGISTNKTNAEEASEEFYDGMSDATAYKMELNTGAFLVLGKDATQRMQMCFIPQEGDVA
jgi:hypothetical protein